MVLEKHIPQVLNADDDDRFLTMQEAIAIQNCRMGMSVDGKDLRIENIPSSLQVASAGGICVGSCVDAGRDRIIYAIVTSGVCSIWAYETITSASWLIIQDSNLASGNLGFSLSNYVDRNIKVVGDLLFWTNNNGDPRCINIESALKANNSSYTGTVAAYSLPILYTSTTLIKRPPAYQLSVTQLQDSSYANNFVLDGAFQFCYFYTYKDGQVSALSPFSDLMNYGNTLYTPFDTFNYVYLDMPLSEYIDDEILIVNYCVKYGNSGGTFIIKSWDKRNTTDAANINAHNGGVTGVISYKFYNDSLGIALDSVSSVNNFDSVPLSAKTLEVAKNRLFLGNIVSGYDTPKESSLTATPILINNNTSVVTAWQYLSFDTYSSPHTNVKNYTFYYINVNGKLYGYNYPTPGTPLPNAVNATDAGIATFHYTDLFNYYWTPGSDGNQYIENTNIGPASGFGIPTAVTITIPPLNTNYPEFKAGSSYNINISFFDKYRRKCGVIDNKVSVNIPDRTTVGGQLVNYIQWALSNTNALAEIPDWAYYYQLSITKNQIFQNFLEVPIASGQGSYVTQDSTTLALTFGVTTYASSNYGIAFDLTQATLESRGYVYTAGDAITVYAIVSGNYVIYQLKVIGQQGKYVICSLTDIPNINTTAYTICLYTPYKSTGNEPLYEVGGIYLVASPATSSRQYTTIAGNISGDAYHLNAVDLQTMNLSKANWLDWERNLGWINIVDKIGQQNLTTTIAFSDTYIDGTNVNGLSKFQPLNVQTLNTESGDIQKLIVSNKIAQELGSIMLCICKNEPYSIYLGETQLVSQTANAFVAQSSGVIGTINALRGNYGTNHPESVIDYLGEVYWFDIKHGTWVQYSSNGTISINGKLDSYYKKFALRYQKQNLTSRIISCIDPIRYHLVACMPSTEATDFPYTIPSYGGSVPSYATTIKSQFSFYDGQPKMILYDAKDNVWKYSIGVVPNWIEYYNNNVYAFIGDVMHQLEAGNDFNSFLGSQLPARIAIAINKDPNGVRTAYSLNVNNRNSDTIKDLFNIALDGNVIPNYVLAYSDYPDEQVTDISSSDVDLSGNSIWENVNGIQYASFLKDRLSPNVSGTPEDKMYAGDYVRGNAIKILLEFAKYDGRLIVNFINIGYEVTSGNNPTNN